MAEAQKKVAEKLRKGYTSASSGGGGTLGALTPLTARLDAWLRRHRPKYHAQLLPGLDDQQVQAFEAALGMELPSGMRAFFRRRNGQAADCYSSLVHNFSLMKQATVVGVRRSLNDFLTRGEFDQANWWSPGWVPFLDNGGGDHYCLDSDGTFTGSPGQIIRFWHDYQDRSVMAPDFDSWLKTVVIRLEKDDFSIDEYGVDIEDSPDGFPLSYDAG